MKIIFIIADITSIGGIERVSSILTNTFIQHNHSVEIVSLFKAHDTVNYHFNKSVSIKYPSNKNYAVQKQGGISRLLMFCSIILNLKKYLKTHNFDLIMSHGFPVSFITWLSGYAQKAIACEHVYHNYYKGIVKMIRTVAYKKFYRVAVLTQNDRRHFSKYLENVVYIPNPLPFQTEQSSSLEYKRIICAGRLSYQKGYDILLNILPPVFKLFPDWKLDIYGEGNLHNELTALSESLGLSNHVFFKGTTSNIMNEYLHSSLFILSSRYEGFSMVLIEAASCGLPIISFDCPEGPADILKNDRGILVRMNDSAGLQEAIIKMLSNSELRKEYGEKAKEIQKDYLPETIYSKWNIVFEEYLKYSADKS